MKNERNRDIEYNRNNNKWRWTWPIIVIVFPFFVKPLRSDQRQMATFNLLIEISKRTNALCTFMRNNHIRADFHSADSFNSKVCASSCSESKSNWKSSKISSKFILLEYHCCLRDYLIIIAQILSAKSNLLHQPIMITTIICWTLIIRKASFDDLSKSVDMDE